MAARKSFVRPQEEEKGRWVSDTFCKRRVPVEYACWSALADLDVLMRLFPFTDPSSFNSTDKGSNGAPNAWSRPLKTGPPPGLATPVVSNPPPVPPRVTKETASLRERFLQLSLNMVGQRVQVTQVDGTVFEGVFHTFTPFASQPMDKRNKYVVKAVKAVKNPMKTGIKNGSTVIVSAEKVSSIHVPSIRLENNGKKDGGLAFQTDSEISRVANRKGHDLVAAGSAWTSPAPNAGNNSRAEAMMGGLGDGVSTRKGGAFAPSSGLRGNIGEWDQFKANEELFDVKATYDENLYTTELDKSQIDTSKLREAERLAREIEGSTSTNLHVAEERGQAMQGDYDEEDRYSGVLNQELQARDEGANIGSGAKKIMNYAAAAAKGDSHAAAVSETEEKRSESIPENSQVSPEATETETQKPDCDEKISGTLLPTPDPNHDVPEIEKEPEEGETEIVGETETVKSQKNTEDPADENKPVSKPDAKAKQFILNPKASSFTPGTRSFSPAPTPAPETPAFDPNAAMAMAGIPPMVSPYMQHPMAQPGMVPMINPHFQMQYQRQYSGMEQHMPPIPHQPQHLQQMQQPPQQQQQQGSVQTSQGIDSDGTAIPGCVDDATAEATTQATAGEGSQDGTVQRKQPQQPPMQPQPQPQPGVPPHYPSYYGGGMTMQMGRQGGPMPAYPQMVGAPPMVPGGYAPMYRLPPQPPMRGTNGGSPYYSSGPQHYQHYMMDGDRSRGRGRGRGRFRKPGGRGGRGFYSNGGGRHGQQQHQHMGGTGPPSSMRDLTGGSGRPSSESPSTSK